MDDPGSFSRPTRSVATLRAMKAAAAAVRKATRRIVAVPFFADAVLAMSDTAAGPPG
jgi:hypothetical protein